MTDSHEYARELQRLADELLARPAFPCPLVNHTVHMNNKNELLAAIKALGSGQKQHSDYFVDYIPAIAQASNFTVTILKSLICRKVQDAVWECDPLLEPTPPAHIEPQPRKATT